MRRFRVLRVPSLLFVACVLAAAGCKEEGTGVEVKSLSFKGLKAVSDGQLRSVLATTRSSKLPWGEKYFFDRTQFEADLQRIAAFYADRGYPAARVRSFDVALSDDQKSVRITIEIEEGEPILVERVDLQGLDALPENHRRALESRLPIAPEHPLDRALLQAGREMILDELKDHGYPTPSVDVSEAAGSSERRRVVGYSARPGRLAYVGPVEIAGAMSVNERIVRRQLTFKSGDTFEQSRLRDSQRKLYSLELFNFVNIEAIRTAQGDTNVQGSEIDRIPVRVTVTEGKHRKVNLGVGYGSEERARGQIDWRHVNFFGGARTAGVVARYSSLDRGVRLNFKQPYLFSPRYAATLSGQSWFSDEPAFKLTTLGGRASIIRQFGGSGSPILGGRQTTTASVTYVNEWEEYEISNAALEDPTFRDDLIALGLDPRCGTGPRCGIGAGQLSSIILEGGRNTTGNLLDAKRGYVANLHLEEAGQWLGGDFDYREVTAEGRFYQSIGTRAVVAVQARAGSIDSTGDEETLVPFFKRYFLGGATNLRGWGRYQVAPLSGGGLPIGGHSFATFSTEVRVPIRGNFGAVLFFDGGNVWTNPWDINLNDLRYDVGPGLRYNTKIGPVRFDVGYQLNPIPDLVVNGEKQTRRIRFHFSIGQAF
ncbi:MAG TPA: BamA/TamA family outer membrane protein [Vicinamibacterales bacterium]|jgi:outer membrane protein assembly complex protein YaeT